MTQATLFPEVPEAAPRPSALAPRTPPPVVTTISRSLDEMQPEEILDYVFAFIGSPEAIEAAFRAIDKVWPGHYANALDFEERLRHARQAEHIPLSRLVLVPVKPGAMVEGETYLTAEIGTSAILAHVLNGPASRARRLSLLFRIEPAPQP